MNLTAAFLTPMFASAMLLAGTAAAEAAQGGKGWKESGEASWYGGWHQGRPTSSGERFDERAMTAAHARLPLGSRVRVTLRDTGRSVVVTINDRLPPKRWRVIDLSRGAAARLGMVDQGLGDVTLTPVSMRVPEEVAEAPEATAENRPGRGGPLNPQRHDRPHTRHGRP
jgi:rare lipoprotein A